MKILIGIPTLNGPDRLRRALLSIHEHTHLSDQLEVIVSDDGSNAHDLEWNKTWCHRFGVPMLMTEERLGIPKQWNRLVRHVPDADVCVLVNDDVEVVRHWLDVLLYSVVNNDVAGMVGLRCETGVTAANGSRRQHIDYHEARLLDGNGALLSSGGACFAFARQNWERVGGFDERYFCFYEELDFGVALATSGRFNLIAEYPVVYHMGGATISANSDANAVLLASREKFADKWKRSLDDMRNDFGRRERPKLLEWNSQVHNWRLP